MVYSAIAAYFLFIYFVYRFAQGRYLVFTGNGTHPIAFVVFLKLYILIFPGVIAVLFPTIPTILRSEQYGVSSQTIFFGSLSIFYVGIAFFILLFVFNSKYGVLKLYYDFNIKNYNFGGLFYYSLLIVFFQILALSVHIFSLGENVPLFLLLKGDFVAAGIAKKMIITGGIGFFKKPIIGYWLKYYFYFSPLFLYYLSFVGRRRIFRLLFYFSIFLSLFYFLIDGHKSIPVYFLLVFFIYRSAFYRQSNVKMLLIGCSLTFAVFIYYLASFGLFGSLTYGLNRFLQRLFVLQSQGLYYIYEIVEPSIEYIYPIMPFSSILFPNYEKADSFVMEYLFGPSLSNVNMNSIFVAEAYSFSGIFGVLISPFFVWSIVLIISFLLRKYSNRDSLFFVPLSFALVPNIPFTQNISYFLFPKELISVTIMFSILYVFYFCARKSNNV